MPTLLERADIAKAPNFIARVQQGLIQIANEVLDEDPGTPLHEERVRLANRVLTNPLGIAPLAAQSVVLNENIGRTTDPVGADQETEAGDGALLYILRTGGVFNDYAQAI